MSGDDTFVYRAGLLFISRCQDASAMHCRFHFSLFADNIMTDLHPVGCIIYE
jgi:hypothetical protein